MSNSRRAKPPAADAAVAALLSVVRCGDCGSTRALQRWNRRVARWEITPLHWESCPVRTGVVAPHGIAEAATRRVAAEFPGVAYVADRGGSGGGWVVAR